MPSLNPSELAMSLVGEVLAEAQVREAISGTALMPGRLETLLRAAIERNAIAIAGAVAKDIAAFEQIEHELAGTKQKLEAEAPPRFLTLKMLETAGHFCLVMAGVGIFATIPTAIFFWYTERWGSVIDFINRPETLALGLAAGALIALARFWYAKELKKYGALRQAYESDESRQSSLRALAEHRQKADAEIRQSVKRRVLDQAQALIAEYVRPSFDTKLGALDASGLSQVSDRESEIITPAHRELSSILQMMRGGSVGIAGPRGAGKSTLMATFCGQHLQELDGEQVLTVMTSAPVEYDARDYILHLFSCVCRRVLARENAPFVTSTWNDANPAQARNSLAFAIKTLLPDALRAAFFAGLLFTALAILIVQSNLDAPKAAVPAAASKPAPDQSPADAPKGGVPVPQPTRHGLQAYLTELGIKPQGLLRTGVALLALSIFIAYALARRRVMKDELPQELVNVRTFRYCLQILFSAHLPVDPLRSASSGSTGSGPGTMVEKAQRWLQEVKFQQSFTSGWSGALKIPLGFDAGANSAVTLSQKQLSLPEIVDQFVDLLRAVTTKYKVHIGIDELDKLESDEKAHKFLNDIKAVFGVRRVYYLVSVSENAMSAFERRGLPFRDAFDSCFDDIINLGYLNFEDARILLANRILQVPIPFSGLCYCLSGGLPRDLLRNCRDLLHTRRVLADKNSIVDVAKSVLETDVREKARASTVLVYRIQVEPQRSEIIEVLHRLNSEAFDAATLTEMAEKLWRIGETAERRQTKSELESAAHYQVRSLARELSSYLHLSTTLLDFFSKSRESDFEEAYRSRKFDRLAQARQSLAMDHAITRSLVTAFRKGEASQGPVNVVA